MSSNLDEVRRLIDELARPIMNYRMARGLLAVSSITDWQRRSAEKKLDNAIIEIDKTVRDYTARTATREHPVG